MKRTVDIAREVQGPYALACGLLEIYPEEIVRPAFDELRIEVGDIASIGRVVTLEISKLGRDNDRASLKLSWQAETHPEFFPSMEADLKLRDAGNNATEVRFVGSYEPPLGAAGALGDAVAGHRVAEQAARGFLTEVCERLERAMAEHQNAS